jgi:CheY-like chemotaxis protein
MNELAGDALKGKRVLIVEDDPFSMDVATILLMHYGAEVHTADNGQEGVELARVTKPDFILSDISMPLMDGWGLIDVLKGDPRTASIPVVALTAHAMPGYRERAIASGFHNFLTKPLTPETFIRELVALLVDLPQFSHLA